MDTPQSKILAVSFGSSRQYLAISKRTINEFLKIYPQALSRIYGPNDLSPDLLSYCVRYPRGFGYYQWKPFIVLDAINSLMDGDVLIYIDGRSGIPKCKVSWIDDLCDQDTSAIPVWDFAAWQLTTPEQSRTTADLMDLFGVTLNSPYAMSGQFAATFFGLRVNQVTRNIVEQWHEIMKENKHLTRNEPSLLPNHKTFLENRWDQSVLSLVLKKNGDEVCKILEIPSSMVLGGKPCLQHNCVNEAAKSIYPWGKPHPRSYFFRVSYLIYHKIYGLKRFVPKGFYPHIRYVITIYRRVLMKLIKNQEMRIKMGDLYKNYYRFDK